MKTKLLLIFIAITATAFSQITLTHSDYADGLAPGSAYTSYATPLFGPTLSVFVGEPSGSAQNWDFTDYELTQAGDGVAIDPTTAPFYSMFPGCNVSLYEEVYGLGSGEDTIRSWTYQELTSDKLLLHGLSDEFEAWPIYDPPAVQAVLPFSYGTTWVEDWDSTYYMPEVWVISKTEVEVDAFGTMVLPQGEYPCLRMTQNHYSISYTPAGIDSLTVRSFHWYAKYLTQLHITSIYEEQFGLSTIEINAFSYSKAGGPVGVEENGLLSSSAILEQNHPNPFSSATVINYTLKQSDFITIEVIDFLGKEIATLVEERQEAGEHNVNYTNTGLQPGVYFYMLKTKDNNLVRRMIVR